MTYPFDTTGVASTNLIRAESHSALESTFKNLHYIIPANAPFFGSGLVVTRTTSTGVITTLVLNQDYTLAMIYLAATNSIGIAVYGGIVLLGNFLSTDIIKVTYQTLGGPWVANIPATIQNIVNSTNNVNIISWDQVTNVPQTFPPTNHTNTLDTTFGMSSLLTAFNTLGTTLANKGATPLNITLGGGLNGTNLLSNGNALTQLNASKLNYYNSTSNAGISIPNPTTCNNVTFYFSNINTGTLQINSLLANSIYANGLAGVTSLTLVFGAYVVLTSDGTKWVMVMGNAMVPVSVNLALSTTAAGIGTTNGNVQADINALHTGIIGSIIVTGSSVAPTGYLAIAATSVLVSTTTYANLFATLAYTYGGSGASFGLPYTNLWPNALTPNAWYYIKY